jgi:hypothetical protein
VGRFGLKRTAIEYGEEENDDGEGWGKKRCFRGTGQVEESTAAQVTQSE